MSHRLIYQGHEVTPLPETFNGHTVDVMTRDGKRHRDVPLSVLDSRWTD